MADSPNLATVWSRRKLICAAGASLLAVPALTLASRQPVLASGRDPMRSVLCPEAECGYRYNPVVGDPDFGIPPGTPFDDLPQDWECPECGTEIRYW